VTATQASNAFLVQDYYIKPCLAARLKGSYSSHTSNFNELCKLSAAPRFAHGSRSFSPPKPEKPASEDKNDDANAYRNTFSSIAARRPRFALSRSHQLTRNEHSLPNPY